MIINPYKKDFPTAPQQTAAILQPYTQLIFPFPADDC